MKRPYSLFTFVAIAVTISLVASVRAQEQVEYGALADHVLDSSGAFAPDGDAVLLGTWAPGFDFSTNQTFSSLSTNFTQFDSTTIGAGGINSMGQFITDALLTNTNFNGKQLYIWVLNSSTPASATSWVIVTNNSSAWTVPTTPGDFTAIDMSDPGTFIPAGAFGVSVFDAANPSGTNMTDWKMTNFSAIPEPSTCALMLAGAVGLLALRRRTKG